MLTTLLLAALLQPSVPTVDSARVQDEIVVIGRRLKDWRGHVRRKNGEHVCKTKKSTGDEVIDAIGCGAMLTCFVRQQPRMNAIAQMDIPKREKKVRFEALSGEFTACFGEERSKRIAALAEARSS